MAVHPYVLSQNEFVNGNQLTYPFQERGLQFGDGIYEVIRVYEGKYDLLDEHLERLYRSATAIKIELPMKKEELYNKLHQLLTQNDITEDAKVYLQATRGSAVRDHLFPLCEANFYAYVQDFPRPMANIQNGVGAIIKADERWQNCYIKSLNLLPNVLAKQEAYENGCFEAILHRDGTVTECSSSNVYLVKNGQIFTHPETKQILHGCVRLRLKKLTEKLSINFIEEAFTVEDLTTADEVFISSSISEVTPIIHIDGNPVNNGEPGEITRKLQKAYEEDAALAKRETNIPK